MTNYYWKILNRVAEAALFKVKVLSYRGGKKAMIQWDYYNSIATRSLDERAESIKETNVKN